MSSLHGVGRGRRAPRQWDGAASGRSGLSGRALVVGLVVGRLPHPLASREQGALKKVKEKQPSIQKC